MSAIDKVGKQLLLPEWVNEAHRIKHRFEKENPNDPYLQAAREAARQRIFRGDKP